MKNILLAGLMIVAFAMPSFSFAQTDVELEAQYRAVLIELIEQLQAQIAILIAQNESLMAKNEPTTEESTESVSVSLGAVSPDIDIDVIVGEKTEDEGRSYVSFKVDTNADKLSVKLARPDGSLAIDGGLNPLTVSDNEFNIEVEVGTYSYVLTVEKDGVTEVKEGSFEVK